MSKEGAWKCIKVPNLMRQVGERGPPEKMPEYSHYHNMCPE